MKILVTGGNGQLGQCLKDISTEIDGVNEYVFVGHHDGIDINSKDLGKFLTEYNPDIVVNCAAYTNVEKAESDYQNSIINFDGATNLAFECDKRNIKLIHISTDYVFDGKKGVPYVEEDKKTPLNKYGMAKSLGETSVLRYNAIVIRTSWLYSEYGKNFFKTMYERVRKEEDTKVVMDQIGTPTYAKDLAKVIVKIINTDNVKTMGGIYHYSNEGTGSWYDFAKAIELLVKEDDKSIIKPCSTGDFPQKAKRPSYSVMSKAKIYKDFNAENRHWFRALKDCIENYEKSILN